MAKNNPDGSAVPEQQLAKLADGDKEALADFYENEYNDLVNLSARLWREFPLKGYDKDGAAASAFESVARAVAEGRCGKTRLDLWKLAAFITRCKIIKKRKKEGLEYEFIKGKKEERGLPTRRKQSKPSDMDELDPMVEMNSTDESISGEGMAHTVIWILQTLKKREDLYKLVILLYDGYSIEGIEEELKCPENIIRDRIGEIRELLKQELGKLPEMSDFLIDLKNWVFTD